MSGAAAGPWITGELIGGTCIGEGPAGKAFFVRIYIIGILCIIK